MAEKKEAVRFLDLETLPGVSIVFAQNVSNTFRRHVHESWIIGLVDEGTRKVTLASETIVIPKGALFIHAPGVPHVCGPDDGETQTYRALGLSRERMINAVQGITGKESTEPTFISPAVINPHLAGLLQKFFSIAETGLAIECDSALMDFLSELLMNYGNILETIPIPETPTDTEPGAIARVREYILDRLTENIRLEDIASVAGLSPFHLQRLFVRHQGVSPLEFLLQHRVKLATELLGRGMPAADVAAETGFYDQSHLNRHFKRIVGVTPGRFAMEHRKNHS